jgi:hypothetical protein
MESPKSKANLVPSDIKRGFFSYRAQKTVFAVLLSQDAQSRSPAFYETIILDFIFKRRHPPKHDYMKSWDDFMA